VDADIQAEILAAFTVEGNELLDGLTSVGDALRGKLGADAVALAGRAMRLLHTLKGGAASVGLEDLAAAAHALEDVLAPIAREKREPPAGLADELVSHLGRLNQLLEEGLKLKRAELTPPPRPSERVVHESDVPTTGTLSTESLSVRIDASRLDGVMGHAGELLTLNARLSLNDQHLDAFSEELGSTVTKVPEPWRRDLLALANSLTTLLRRGRQDAASLSRVTADLGASVRRLRLVPLQSLAPVWRRAALEAAHALGKQVELKVELGGIELDKRVLDEIREPVIHLLRNAVGHGIEPPDARRRVGKPLHGQVRVTARLEGPLVHLELCDDGAGIDTDKLARAAVTAGRVDAERVAKMSEAERVALAFEEGVSTASELTNVAGRGVGLDVVRRAVTDLGGTLEASARGPLGGAAFLLRLPIDVLSTQVLLVRVGEAVWALPLSQIERTARVRRADVKTVDGVSTGPLEDGTLVRLIWLGGERKVEAADDAWLRVVLLDASRGRAGLVVSEVLAEDEVVMRPLPWNLKHMRGVLGAASLADGAVIIVLDATRLAATGARPASTWASVPRRTSRTRILVVDDSLTHRTLTQNVLLSAGYEAVVSPDGLAGWRALEEGAFDLLLSDVEMPGLDGIELTRRVRASRKHASLPVILVTGLGKRDDIARGLEAGANEYLVKGQLESEKLLQAVARNLVGRARD
jgi:two-component system chemotaxis sensor kinase CheA